MDLDTTVREHKKAIVDLQQRCAEATIQRDVFRSLLIEHGCPIVDGCYLPTVVGEWLAQATAPGLCRNCCMPAESLESVNKAFVTGADFTKDEVGAFTSADYALPHVLTFSTDALSHSVLDAIGRRFLLGCERGCWSVRDVGSGTGGDTVEFEGLAGALRYAARRLEGHSVEDACRTVSDRNHPCLIVRGS